MRCWMVSIALLSLAACGRDPVETCDANLEGIWRDAAGRRYHVLDGRGTVAIYPLFDATHPADPMPDAVYAPFMFELFRRPTVISGARRQRVEVGGKVCTMKARAELESCNSDALTIAHTSSARVRWTDGDCVPAPRPVQRLVLSR